MEHLIKLQASPADRSTERLEGLGAACAPVAFAATLKTNPSLRREVAALIADETSDLQQEVAATLAIYGEKPVVAIEGLTFTEEQVLGPWFPDEPLA